MTLFANIVVALVGVYLLAVRWIRGMQPPEENHARRVAARRGSK